MKKLLLLIAIVCVVGRFLLHSLIRVFLFIKLSLLYSLFRNITAVLFAIQLSNSDNRCSIYDWK